MLKLRIILLAGALAVATAPAVAIDLPDYGSKNFSPSGDTPSYFANETAPVSARTADTTQSDWSAVDEMAPARSAAEGTRSAHSQRGRHGRYSVTQRSSRYAGRVHSVRGPGGNYAGGTGHHVAAQTRSANSARAATVKHGRAGARHAAAAGRYAVN